MKLWPVAEGDNEDAQSSETKRPPFPGIYLLYLMKEIKTDKGGKDRLGDEEDRLADCQGSQL